VVFVVTGVAERVSKMKDRGAQFMWTEAGLAAENLFLQATALGEGSTFVGGYKPDAAKAFLKLPAQEEVLAVLPVGKRQ
jgi:nitroreductase